MSRNYNNKSSGGGGYSQKHQRYASLVALGLSSLLPSFTFATDSDEALTQLLTQAPSNPNDSKVQTIANYSPVVDLRTTRAVVVDETRNPPFPSGGTWNTDTIVNVNLQSVNYIYWASRTFQANNGATVTMNFNVGKPQDEWDSKGILTENETDTLAFDGDGFFDITANITGSANNASGSFIGTWDTSIYSAPRTRITSRLRFQAKGNVRNFVFLYGTQNGNGTHIFNSPYLEVDMSGSTYTNNGNGEKFIFDSSSDTNPNVYFNANQSNNSQAYSESSILKFTGSISTGVGARLYAYFTNADSFLNGNMYLSGGESKISFSNSSSMRGNIIIKGGGNHSFTFDNANFIGVIKSDNGSAKGTNSSITFKNTAKKIFGSTTEGIVASTYNGSVTGSFDVSKTSMTVINGGANGDKGFLGTGTNRLVFDFKNNAKIGLANDNTRQFTIASGNANSAYVLNAFQSGSTPLDYTALNANNSLYSKIKDAGISIAVDTQGATTNNHLNGTLLFTNTAINIGNSETLFSSAEKIVGNGNALNGLALGAMFGNATWNDANNDGSISSDEISANPNYTNYQLIGANTTPSTDNGVDSKTSTGNIGSSGDGIKKQVGFIFASGEATNGYVFNGEKQGYSGTIAGGTTDSKYYFANAGYITRTQISNALGDLVLFNTAFRGDLGVDNKDVSIMLDFSGERNGLRAETGTGNANIVGAGSKNITFNFTDNTKKEKFVGAVVGNATQDNSVATGGTPDNQTAKYTMLNLKKYTADNTEATNNGAISANADTRGIDGRAGSKTLIDAIQGAGLTNFNNTSGNNLDSIYGNEAGKNAKTNISNLSETNTTLALRGTSLDTTGLNFDNYKYDLAFGGGMGEIEGIAIKDSKLYGNIDLSSNSQTGHSIILKGDSLGDQSTITFNSTTFGTSGSSTFIYDDSTAKETTSKTLTLNGLSDTNYLSAGSYINISKTNLRGNIWLSNNSVANIRFTDGNTWSMDTSGIYLKNGSNLIVHGTINAVTSNTTPTLKIRTSANQQNIQLLNTGASVIWKNDVNYKTNLAQTFQLRGTSLTTTGSSNNDKRLSGKIGTGTFNMVFAKGSALQTTVADTTKSTNYKITDIGLESVEQYKGTYSSNGYVGNYIAESSGAITGIDSNTGFNITFIGSQAWSANEGDISTENYFGRASTLALVNASQKWDSVVNNVNGISAGYIGNFFKRDFGTQANIVIEGTSLDWGNETSDGGGIVRRGGNQDKLNFTITFINEGSSDSTNTDKTYVGDKYTELATTRANGALKDSILKVQESKLVNGLNFKGANANVLFVGDESQSLDGTTNGGQKKILEGGSANSTFTFRDSDLNAGSGTSSIQGIRGTIAFDLTHSSEDMAVYGTLKNMLNGGKHQVQFKAKSGDEPVTIDRLVFVNTSDISGASTLTQLGTDGQYYKDSEVFSSSTIEKNYSDLAKLNTIDTTNSSSLIFGKNGVSTSVALTSGEVFFVGANSHGFGNTTQAVGNIADGTQATNTSGVTTLGNSTGGTLTFIDAGTLKVANIQNGSGTLNLIGNTRIELQGADATKTLTLYTAGNSATRTDPITGNGIIINAVFSGSNVLGDGVAVKGENGTDIASSLGNIASNVNIGQAGEQTEYHILFDYSEALKNTDNNYGFGKYQVYQGNIAGLTSNSIIKFKNAGYIYGDQIGNTDATILLDNTQLKDDFRGDKAILDFRNNKSGIGGNILTSDVRAITADMTTNVLSRKDLTFDLTDTTKLAYTYNIQAGDKVAPNYGEDDTAPSILTFQNTATAMTLGDDDGVARGANTNPSDFIKSLAEDIGFSGIGSASTTAPETPFDSDDNVNTTKSKASYILAGTILKFQGIDIQAGSTHTITEATYDLDLNFNSQVQNGATGLGEDLRASTLTANTIVMGDSTARNLSLTFSGKGSLAGATIGNNTNVLNVKLKENARFNLNASSDNGLIGTLVLTNGTTDSSNALANVAKDSSLTIGAGAMSFVGKFSQKDDTSITTAGAINVAFNGENKAYGTLVGKGNVSVTLSGNALFSETEASALGFVKDSNQFADLVIDLTTSSSIALNLAHTSGMVGLIGATSSTYTNLNLSSVTGDVALKGNFNLTEGASFGGTSTSRLKVVDNSLSLKMENEKTLTIAENGIIDTTSKTINLYVRGGNEGSNNLVFTNLGNSVSNIIITSQSWGVAGTWNIRGTNIQISGLIGANKNQQKNLIFSKGIGTQTTTSNADNRGFLNLSELNTSDKIANSALTFTNSGFLLVDYGTLTLIGKDSLDANASTHKVDGGMSAEDKKNNGANSKKLSIGLYNTILRSGDVLLDNTNPNSGWDNDTIVDDNVTIRGTDIFNMSVKKGTADATKLANNSTINAVFVNGDNLLKSAQQQRGATATPTILTGSTYINAENGANDALKTTLAQYATNNAGGALSDSILKTLQSRAYGNITLESTVKANMKFIGSDSHSFDGKTKVNGNNVYHTSDNLTWYQYEIGDGTNNKTNGAVYLASSPTSSLDSATLATLSGGNSSSRFDFDHTSVNLDLIKNAGGETYVYNSNIVGEIAVSGGSPSTIPADSSTAIFFNEAMTTPLPTASANFIQSQANNGTNLDLSTAHKMTAENLTGSSGVKTLANTAKTTNLVFIGKGSVDTGNTTKSENADKDGKAQSIDLSFMPNADGTVSGYANYTFVNAGEFTQEQIALDSFNGTQTSTPDGSKTIFGTNSVVLIDTYVLGDRAFAQKGFIDMRENRNQLSSWSGGADINQFLIFDFHNGTNNANFNGGKGNAITNTSANSRYVFTSIFKDSLSNTSEGRTLTLTTNGLKGAINVQLKGAGTINPILSSEDNTNVVGYLGLRGVSIEGDIDEATNGVDIVFNSTSNISYVDKFSETGEYSYSIDNLGYNKVANVNGIANTNDYASGYAVLKTESDKDKVTIKGTSTKLITFIGERAINEEVGGFEKLKIEGGSIASNYTFYSVGTLSNAFLQGVKLQKDESNTKANLGTFTIANSTINGAINVDANTSDSNTENKARLILDNVVYSGSISGGLIKDVKFAKGSNDIKITGGSEHSSYDFSNLAGSSINLDIDMTNGNAYYNPTITGLNQGNISVVGSLKLGDNTSVAFNDDAKWTMTKDSRVATLTLNNLGTNYNLDLASAPRSSNAVATQNVDAQSTNPDLRVLNVNTLSSNGGQVLLGTVIDTTTPSNSMSDKIKASVISGGTLYVTAKDSSINSGSFDTNGDNAIVLVTASSVNSGANVEGAERKQGLSYVSTELEHQVYINALGEWQTLSDENSAIANSHRWVLSSFDTSTNQELVDESGFIVSNPYRMLLIETNNLNKRMGDLRDNDYNQGAWIRVFNGSDSGEGSKNLYTNIQLGYDYGTPAIGAKNYSGVAFSTSIVDIDGNQYSGKANTYSLAVYNSYIADSGFYVDTIGKYLYTDQKLSPTGSSDSSFGSHALSLGLEVGYRAYMGETNFYFETQAEAIGGVIFGVKDIAMGEIGGMNITGDLKTTLSLNTRVGIVQGYSLKTQSGFRADFRLGVSLVNESVNDNNSITLYDSITEASTSIANDTKAVLNVGTNLILTDQWRVYLDAERSFGGKRNVDYQANIGARFSFGDITKPLPKPEKPLPLKVEEKK